MVLLYCLYNTTMRCGKYYPTKMRIEELLEKGPNISETVLLSFVFSATLFQLNPYIKKFPMATTRSKKSPASTLKSTLALYYTRVIGAVFTIIFLRTIIFPHATLSPIGVDYNSQSLPGRAELRAYYAGTALIVVGGMLHQDIKVRVKLFLIQCLLGGFACARVVGYCIEGGGDFGADCIFVIEVIGATVAHVLKRMETESDKKK